MKSETPLLRCFWILCIVLVSGSYSAAATNSKSHQQPELKAPRNLQEALDRLEKTLPSETLEKIRKCSEPEMIDYHFGLGMWMRNNWGLWSNGPLYDYFRKLGLHHPDDMSGVILTSLWRQLHKQPLRVEDQVAEYQAYWRYATPPDPKSNPQCASGIETTMSWSTDAPQQEMRGIHMGRCCSSNVVWAYHADRGWFQPDQSQLSAWEKSSETASNPCKEKQP